MSMNRVSWCFADMEFFIPLVNSMPHGATKPEPQICNTNETLTLAKQRLRSG
jgi:hypothetical protein